MSLWLRGRPLAWCGPAAVGVIVIRRSGPACLTPVLPASCGAGCSRDVQKDYATALRCLSEAMEEAPDSEHLNLVKTEVLMAMGKYDDALAITTQLIHNKFSSTKLLQLRARCYYMMVRLCWGACFACGALFGRQGRRWQWCVAGFGWLSRVTWIRPRCIW